MFDWEDCPAAARDPKVLGGAWVFLGTRVPLYALFANLKGGTTTTEFVAWFPNVTKQQVDAVLDFQVRFLRQSRAE